MVNFEVDCVKCNFENLYKIRFWNLQIYIILHEYICIRILLIYNIIISNNLITDVIGNTKKKHYRYNIIIIDYFFIYLFLW